MIRPLPVGTQIASMKADWPMFKVKNVAHASVTARWVGTLKPHLVAYKLEVRMSGGWPEVRILSPELKTLPGNPEGRLPHVYPPADDMTLCLFDPRGGEWVPSMLISKTIIPWAIDWIACYEFWLMTGQWKGGGRHPDKAGDAGQGATS
jgi:hypothetical protein